MDGCCGWYTTIFVILVHHKVDDIRPCASVLLSGFTWQSVFPILFVDALIKMACKRPYMVFNADTRQRISELWSITPFVFLQP